MPRPPKWWDRAARTFGYAIDAHAPQRRLTECVGLLGQAVAQSAGAVLAARGQWATNDKLLTTRAGLRAVDAFLSDLSADPNMLINAGQAALKTCHDAVRETVIGAAEP